MSLDSELEIGHHKSRPLDKDSPIDQDEVNIDF
jgi:hypothetical protein